MAESLGHGILDLKKGEFGVYLAFGLAHVRHDDEAAAILEDFFKGGKGATDTGIIGDVAVLIQRHVEVYTYYRLFAGEIVIVKFHVVRVYVVFVVLVRCENQMQKYVILSEYRSRQMIFLEF